MKKFKLITISYLVLLTLPFISLAAEPSLNEIISTIHKTYQRADTYIDTGTVQTVFIVSGRRRTNLKPFTTAFVRPDLFRFEFRSRRGEFEWDNYIVWKRGKIIKTWWSAMDTQELPASLGMAVAGATGVSGGSAHLIPSLLLPDVIGGRKITELSDARLAGREAGLYKIEGQDSRGSSTKIWVDPNTFLIIRVFSYTKHSDFDVEETITYSSEINVNIDRKYLEFK